MASRTQAILVALLLVVFNTCLSSGRSKYDSTVWTVINGQHVETSYYSILQDADTSGLSQTAKEIHRLCKSIHENADSTSLKLDFLRRFPGSFDLFLQLFGYPISELCSNYDVYTSMFHELVMEYPKTGGEVLMPILRDAKHEADAVSNLRRTAIVFATTHTNEFSTLLSRECDECQRNIAAFIADVAVHKSSNYTEYQSIIDEIKLLGYYDLVEIFEKARVERMNQKH